MKYPRADELGDSWQVLAVESAQTELKLAAKNAVITDTPFHKVNEDFTRIIKELTDELENERLIIRCRQVLPVFAYRVYIGLLNVFGLGTPNNLLALGTMQTAGGELGRIAAQAQASIPRLSVRDWAYNRATPNFVQYAQVQEKVIKGLKEIAAMEPKPDYTSNVNLRNIAEMEIRYQHQVGELERLKANGTRFVWIEPHSNCSKRCEKYQGKLYSLDKTNGHIDGEYFMPLEVATSNPADRYTTKAGITYQNGCITGFNCRHRLIPYRKGNKPAAIPAKVVERQRRIEEEQRQMEREIRRWREVRLMLGGIGAGKAYTAANKRCVQLREKYEAFSQKNRVPFYRERLRVLSGEQLQSTAKAPKWLINLIPEKSKAAFDEKMQSLNRY